MTAYGIFGEKQGEYDYIGFVNADNQSDAMAEFVEGKSDEEIARYHRYFIFDFEDSAEFTDEEAQDIATME